MLTPDSSDQSCGRVRPPVREILLSGLAVGLLKVLFATVRVEMEDHAGLTNNRLSGPCIILFWHNRILGITAAFRKYYPAARPGVTVLTSPSRDGEILARIVAGFGMGAARGSSSRRGARALRELIALIRKSRDIAITPDGPRGPRYTLGPGAIQLASLTGTPLVAAHAKFFHASRMKTWDGFQIPWPFSRIRVVVTAPVVIPPDLSPPQFEEWRQRIEDHLKKTALDYD